MLAGNSALVTGGGTGIGRAIAVRFAEEGASVCVVGRREEPLRETARLIGRACTWQRCDISHQAEFEAAIHALPRLDILVNNAAAAFGLDALRDDIAKWKEMLDTNMMGPLYGCRAAARKMVAQGGGGRIINVTSIHGNLAEVGSVHYGMAKAAVNQMSRALANEWAPHGILVNVIAPGFVDTPMSRVSGVNELETDWFKDIYVKRRKIPLARAGRPEEIAEAALFLANPRNTYMTGHVLTVDGGLSIVF
jgi:NAD(P)-dependent dehydrogenase (short-subunit alcohol dehydrogenase family)